MVVRPGELDAERFRSLVAAGRTSAPADAAEQLREALALWRGRAVEEFADEPFARDAAAELEELRVTALEGRIEAELGLGAAGALVGELQALVAAHPLRERFHAQLMLALYRSGRQAEALDVYRRARTRLVEELGIEPSAELRALERAILRQDPALDGPAPGGAQAVEVPQALRREGAQGPFVGGAEALARLRAGWAGGERQLVLVAGEPGIGKTRLAAEFAREVFDAGATVLYGRSDAGSLVPYQPLIGALGPYVSARADALRERLE